MTKSTHVCCSAGVIGAGACGHVKLFMVAGDLDSVPHACTSTLAH